MRGLGSRRQSPDLNKRDVLHLRGNQVGYIRVFARYALPSKTREEEFHRRRREGLPDTSRFEGRSVEEDVFVGTGLPRDVAPIQYWLSVATNCLALGGGGTWPLSFADRFCSAAVRIDAA